MKSVDDALVRKISKRAAELTEATAANLSRMVQIPSLCGEEGPVIETIGQMASDAGVQDVRVDGLGNLIVRVGNGPRTLAIDAHVDTVDTGDLSQWNDDPFSGKIADGFVHGRGSVDQEGGAAAMVTAAGLLRELAYDEGLSIYFTFTIMEEDCDGLCWNYIIEKEGLLPDFAVITEPTNLGVYRGHRGRMEMDVVFSGVSAHGSAPERGDNAIYRGARCALGIEALNEELIPDFFLGKGTLVVSQFRSRAPSLCAVADGADIHVDRRLTWGEDKETAVGEIEAVVSETMASGAATPPGLSPAPPQVTLPYYERKSYRGVAHPQEAYFPTWKTAEDHPLVLSGVDTSKTLFQEPPVVGKWTFSTNGVAISGKHGVPTIGYGPGNEIYAHAPNERIPIGNLTKASAFYALLPYILEQYLEEQS